MAVIVKIDGVWMGLCLIVDGVVCQVRRSLRMFGGTFSRVSGDRGVHLLRS